MFVCFFSVKCVEKLKDDPSSEKCIIVLASSYGRDLVAANSSFAIFTNGNAILFLISAFTVSPPTTCLNFPVCCNLFEGKSAQMLANFPCSKATANRLKHMSCIVTALQLSGPRNALISSSVVVFPFAPRPTTARPYEKSSYDTKCNREVLGILGVDFRLGPHLETSRFWDILPSDHTLLEFWRSRRVQVCLVGDEWLKFCLHHIKNSILAYDKLRLSQICSTGAAPCMKTYVSVEPISSVLIKSSHDLAFDQVFAALTVDA